MGERRLPRRWADLIRQLLLFGLAYALYEVVRWLVDGPDAARAAGDATRIIDLERRLHVFVEPSVQAWTQGRPWLMDIAAATYLDAHTVLTIGALLFIYLRRNDSYRFVRTMFMVAMALALVGYAAYPTAPPRLMPQWGFTDPVRQLTGIDAERGPGSILINPDAAVPSMHICFALMTGAAMAMLTRRPALRVLWALYPVGMTFAVVATGNHYLCDIVLGALTAGAAAVLSRALLARAHPAVPAFGQAPAPSTPR
ncbi:MAG TPA: phosphatase PAP2 family protein [Solirubrobacteraceae bacterium]|nr:phosphatase PAP2 family protein [Solirubrobacteraceae bacterium]